MVKICSYSTLLLSCNIVVLLIVAVSTDYWQYRGFNQENITRVFQTIEGADVTRPKDTLTYILVTTMMPRRNNVSSDDQFVHYHSPMYVRIFENGTLDSSGNVLEVVQVFLFIQYGNLFRDCEDLEDTVRKQLGLKMLRPEKCVIFLSAEPSSTDEAVFNPDTIRVEVASLCTAIISILCFTVSLAAGSLGSLSKNYRYMIIASGTSLIAGIILITSIALFNGKTHLQWKGELLPNLQFPYKDIIIENKIRTFGWSFFLAWTCVAMMFTSSFSWLYKSEHLRQPEDNEFVRMYEVSTRQHGADREDVRHGHGDDDRFALVEYSF